MSNTCCDSFEAPVVTVRGERKGLVDLLLGAVSAVVDRVYLWQERSAQRAQLAALDDHRLKDLGISRAEAAREAAKPFWRP